jgi:large repetitive protein
LVTTGTTAVMGLAQGDYQYRLVAGNGFGTSGRRTFFVSPPLPGAPVAPFTPTNNSITADTTPELDWAAPTSNGGTVTGYSVEISTTNNFSAPIVGSPFDAGATTTFTLPALPDNKYYWKVHAHNSVGAYGGYSGVLSFTVDTTKPNPPASLNAPADNFVSTSARPAFSWTAPIGGASGYRFEISTDNGDFDPPAIPDAIVTTTLYTPTVSLPQGTYYWQVWAQDAAGNEGLTATGIHTLTVDYRTAPAANHTVTTATTSNITFSWMLVTGAPVGTTYQIEIDANFDATPETLSASVTTGTTTVTGLAQGDYQYRLVAGNGFGTSGWRTFFVSPPLPGAPVAPFTPVNGAFINDTTPTLQWNTPTLNSGNVTGYMVEIATGKNFTSPIGGSPFDAGATTSFTPSALGENTYYWRVRAKTALNLFGNYSADLSFTVDTTAPPFAPNRIAPLDNTLTNLPRPTFTWGKATDATRYVIEIDDDINFNNRVFHTVTVTTTSYVLPTSTYLLQGVYYWRVWAMDAAGNLNPGPITPYTLNVNYAKTPTDNAVIIGVTGAKVTFTWTAVPITPITANTLRVQVANDSNFTLIEHVSPWLASNIVTYSTPSALDHGEYFWRVVVNGHPVLPNALANSFRISPVAPPAPTLSAPATFTNDTTPVFNWNAVSSASGAIVTGYELQISMSNNFAVLVGGNTITIAGQSSVSYEWVSELPTSTGQVYYARIRAVNSLNVYGNWSAVRNFTLDTTAPSVPVLTAPANNSTVATLTPTFIWTTVPGVARYEIRYSTSPNLVGITPINVTTTSYRPSSALTTNNNYYWEVRAIDAAGNAIDWDNAGIWDSISNRRTVKITG